MAKDAGLNYPSISLPAAIERVRALFDEAHRRRLSRLEIAKHLGYGSLNGASVTLIGNLTKYGLLDGRGDDVRVSDDAFVILLEERGSAERAAAVRRAAGRPELFRALNEQFEGGPMPSENAVRIRLEKMGFPPKIATVAARAYRETIELAESEGAAYNEPVAETSGEDATEERMHPTARVAPVSTSTPPAVLTRTAMPAPAALEAPARGYKQDVFSLDEGEAVVRWPEGLSAESFEDFKGWLELVLRKVERSAKKEPAFYPTMPDTYVDAEDEG
jgi:hypothetical protein